MNKLLITSVLLASFSCNPPFADKAAPGVNEFEPGGRFTVKLPENHSDGYTWQLDGAYDKAAVEQVNAVWHGNEKGIYFNFNALAAGQTTLSFVKRKYTDTVELKSFIVKISSH